MNSHLKLVAVSVFGSLFFTACQVAPVTAVPQGVPLRISASEQHQALALGPLVSKLDTAASKFGVSYGWFCEPAIQPRLTVDTPIVSRGDLDRAFRTVLEPLGYNLQKPQNSVFESPEPPKQVLGGTITKIVLNVCHPFTGSPALNVGNPSIAKGNAAIEITWELYNVADRSVVFKSSVESSFETKENVAGGAATVIVNTLTENLRNLASDSKFKDAVVKGGAPRRPDGKAI